jgi:hypothetical protein
MKLTTVTITGVDERTHAYDLCELHADFPFVEWGVLLSASREGKDPRYPAQWWIQSLLDRTDGLPLAGHLCGSYSRDAISGAFLWAIEHPEQFRRFRRLQLNGAKWGIETAARLSKYKDRFPAKEFIVQVDWFPNGQFDDLAFLLDRSGGRGVEITKFPAPPDGVRCGYAGGLGPDNLEKALAAITALPGDGAVWVDMESQVRTDDWLDLAKVRRCLEIARPFVEGVQ